MSGYKTYSVTVEVEVAVKDNGLVLQNPDSAAAATRHMLKLLMPMGWRKNGVRYDTFTLRVHGEDKQEVALP